MCSISLYLSLASGINPDDFDIYGMDGGTLGSDDEKTPLNANNQETPRYVKSHFNNGVFEYTNSFCF